MARSCNPRNKGATQLFFFKVTELHTIVQHLLLFKKRIFIEKYKKMVE